MARKLYLLTVPTSAAPEVRAFTSEPALLRLLAREYDWLLDSDNPPATVAVALARIQEATGETLCLIRNRAELEHALRLDVANWRALQAAVGRIADREGWPLPAERLA